MQNTEALDDRAQPARTRRWFQDVSVVLGGAALGQLVVLAVLPVTSRLFTPAELGAFGVFLAIVAVLYGVAAFRLEAAINVASDEDQAADLLLAAMGPAALVGGLTTVAGLAAGGPAAEALGTPELARWLWLAGPTVTMASWFLTLVFWHTRTGAFGTISTGRIVQGVALAGGQVAAGVAGLGVGGLLVVPAVSWALAAGVLAAAPLRTGLRGHHSRSVIASVSRFRRFPLVATWSVLCNRVATEVAPVAFAALHGPRVAGFYLVASRLVYRPVGMVSQSVSQVFLHRAAPLWREDPAALRPLIRQTSRTLVLVAIGPALVLVAFGPGVFALVLGDEWREAGVYAALLVSMAIAGAASTSFTPTFAVTERQGLQLVREVLRLSMVVAAFVVASVAGLGPRATVALYGLVATLGYLMLLGAIWHVARPASAPAVREVPA